MLTSNNSAAQNSNQLKLNLDALVTNLNLVNIIQQPKPIIIENVNNNKFNTQKSFDNSNGFNFIDESKLKMFSFLAERKLKEKEWHSKYFVDDNSKAKQNSNENNNNNKKQNNSKNQQRASSAIEKLNSNNKLANKNLEKNNDNQNINKQNQDFFPKVVSLDVKLTELRAICKQLLNTIENLEKILIEFKEKRLKVDYADIQEETKQIRIHNEQIKNASRLMYNFQNQLRQMEFDLNKPDKVINDNQKSQIISRLMNTQRYVIKSIENLNQTYPYRNDSSNKLYKNLFKHLTASIEVFSRLVYVLNLDPDGSVKSLNERMFNCDKIIKESCDDDEENNDKNSKKVKDIIVPTKIKPNVVEKPVKKVIEIKQTKKQKDVKKLKLNPVTKEIFDSNVVQRIDIADKPIRPVLVKKTVQTARLFPSSRVKSANSIAIRNESAKSQQHPNHYHSYRNDTNLKRTRSFTEFEENENYSNPQTPHKIEFISRTQRNNSNNYNSNNNSFNDSNYQQYDIDAYNTSSRLNSARENDIELYQLHNKYKNFENYKNNLNKHQQKQKQMEDSFNFNQSFNSISSPLKAYSLNMNNHSEYSFINNLNNKLNHMKEESDLIRRKYEKLKYSNDAIKNKKSIPYAECYLKIEEPKLNQNLTIYPVDDEFNKPKQAALTEEHSLHVHHLNLPKKQQIERILEYKRKFSNYSKRNTYLSNSQINEVKLFDRLSEDVFDDCFTSICYEIEGLNNDLANNLLNTELIK